MRLGFKFCNTVVLAGYQETRFEADAVPRNTLVSTVQPDKKKACAEKTSNSWTCSATSAPKQRVPHDHPLRPLRVMTDEAKGIATTVQQAVRQDGATVDRAREVVARAPAASPVLGAQRANVDGTARL